MRNGYRIIDADRHLMEPRDLWDNYLEAKYRHRAPVQVGQWSAAWVVDGVQNNDGARFQGLPREELARARVGFWTEPHWRTVYREAIEDGFSPKSYLVDMDREGVEAAVCFGTAILFFNWRDRMEPDYAAALCRAYNDWLHDYCSAAPDRIFGIAALPMQDPRAAAKEAARAVEKLGHVGFFIRPNPLLGRSWHDPVYDYFYDAVQELGKPLCFHEGASSNMPQARLPYGKTFHTRHVMCHPFEQMLACLSMAGLGVFERHPRLKAFFAESTSGWVPFWLERLDRLHGNRALGRDAPTREKPSFYYRRQGSVTCEAGEETLPAYERHVGAHNLMWASDYPHPDETLKYPNTVDPLVNEVRISAETVRKVLWDNPNAIFGLGLE
jgi:predicted TIM-barrel fold metal-dependent hydrolase